MQVDPLLHGGGYGNLQAYCAFDPVNQIDPTGAIPRAIVDAYTWFDQVGGDDFIVGMGDAATFGLSKRVRDGVGLGDVIEECGAGYVLGEYAAALLPWSQYKTLGNHMRRGKEYNLFGGRVRVAPWGNRSPSGAWPSHRIGRFPHDHRRRPHPGSKRRRRGESAPGQSMDRHRPWEKHHDDSSFWDRF